MIIHIKNYLRIIYRYAWKNKTNRYVLLVYIVTVLIAATNIFGFSKKPPYKCWVLASLVFTSGYTLCFYSFGRKNGWFKKLGGDYTASIIVAHIPLLGITFLVANDYIHLFSFTPGRLFLLILMFIFAFLFSCLNWSLHERLIEVANDEEDSEKKNKLIKQSKSFRNAVFMGDLPAAIGFLILLIYGIFIGSCIQMDYFFSGAIAFQIMASNAVWIFNDDRIFEKL